MQFLVTQSGIFKLDVKINQISLAGMPINVKVRNGLPGPSSFQVYGSGLTKLVAGITSTFVVRVQDLFGNSVNISNLDSFPFVAEIVDGTKERKCNSIPGDATVCALELVPVHVQGRLSLGVPVMIFDGLNTVSVYSDVVVTWVATNSLARKMQLTFSKQHAASSPYNITVRTAPIQAGSSIASGAGMSAARVGDTSEIMVMARDAFQNQMTDAGTLYDVQLVGPTRIRAEFRSIQVTGEIFRYTFTSFVVGTYNVSVRLNGVHLSGSPSVIEIEPNIANAARCSIIGDGASFGTAGIAATLTLFARDSFGNDIPYGGDVFLADITNPTFSRTIVVPADQNDGSYRLAFASSISGPHILSITLGGKDVFGSPFTVDVQAGALDLSATGIIFEMEAKAGDEHEIAVEAKDAFGNTRTDGLSDFYVIMPSKREYRPMFISDPTDRSKQRFDNMYLSQFVWTRSGIYNIEVQTAVTDQFGRTSRAQLADSPIVIAFGAGEISSPRCTATGSGTTGISAGGNASLLIHTRDTYMNDVTVGGAAGSIKIFLTYTNPIRIVNFTAEDLNNGKYLSWFILTSAGSYGVEIKRAGIDISGSPFLIQVAVGPLDPEKTLITGSGIYGGVISRKTLFNAKTYDSYGNFITKGSAQVQVILSDMRFTTIPQVSDLGNGESQVIYMGVVLGSFGISVVVNNVTVPGSPFPANIVLQAGDPSELKSIIVSPLPMSVVAGTSGLMVLELRDQLGIKIEVGDHLSSFSARFDEVPGVVLAMPIKEGVPNEDGTYNILLPSSITRAGTYNMNVFVKLKKIQGSPFNITVGPSDVYAMATRCLPMALGQIYTVGTAGVTGQFLVEVRDFYGNAVVSDPRVDIGLAAISSGQGSSSTIIIQQLGGFVEVNFVATRAGLYSILVTVAEVEIRGVPFNIQVVPSRFYPPGSVANVTLFQNALVGRSLTYRLLSLDKFGNIVDTEGASVNGMATGDANYLSREELNRIQPIRGETQYTGIGQYTGKVSFTRSGRYVFALSFDGEQIKGSPFQLFAGPLSPNAFYSTVTGVGTRNGVTGQIATFEIITRDQFSNPVTLGGIVFEAALSSPYKCTTACTFQESANIFDLGTGKYLGFFTVEVPGVYRLDLQADRQHLAGSPYEVNIAVPLAPVPTIGKFMASGSYVSIKFDVSTDLGQVSTDASCETLMDDPSLRLGRGCTLFWYNPKELWIRLGSEATLMPREDIKLRSEVIRNAKMTSDYSAGSVRVNVPDNPVSSTAIIEGPAHIGACDVLELDARSSTGSAGRDLRFRWGVTPGGFSEERILDRIRSQNADTPCPAWSLAGGCHDPVLNVDAAMMDTGINYEFNLETMNVFGEKSTVKHMVKRLAEGVPLIYIDGGPTQNASPTSDLHLSIDVKASSCGQSNLSYAWNALSASDGILPAVRSSPTRRLFIPKNTLRAGIDFVYQASAEAVINGRPVVVTSDLLIRVNRMSLVARIFGGSRCISVSDSANLRADVIGDSSAVPSLSVEWGCEPWPCFQGGDKVLLVDNLQVTIPPGNLVPGHYKFTAKLVGQFGSTFFRSTASMMLYVTPAAQPMVFAVMPAVQYQNPRNVLGVLGSPESYIDPTLLFEWRQIRGGDAFTPTALIGLAGQFQDSLVFASQALMEGASYRFRIEIKSADGLGFAEVDLSISQAPSGGSFSVLPTVGFSVDTIFELKASDWTDIPDNLPLAYIYTYVLDVEPDSIEIAQIPIAESSHQYITARLPNVQKTARDASFSVQVINMARCDVRRDVVVRVKWPPNSQATATLMQQKIGTASELGDMASLLSLSTCLTSLLDTSLAQRRAGASLCPNDGHNCDNDHLRLYLVERIGESLSQVVPKTEEAAMFANSIHRVGSDTSNTTTQSACLDLTKRVLLHALNGSGMSQETMDSTTAAFSDILTASLHTSAESAVQHSENMSTQISDLVDDMASYQLNMMYVGQSPKISAANYVQLLVARTRLLGANWSLPKTVTEIKRRRSNEPERRIHVSMPGDGLPAAASVSLTAIDLVAVQWGTDMHPREKRPIGSDTLTLNLTTHYENGTTLRQDRLEAPVKITFAQEDTTRAKRGADVFDRCNYWDPQKSSFLGTGAIVGKISYTHVTCEAFHMTDFASVLFKSLGDVDDILTINEANPFLRWTPDRILAFAVCWVLLFTYWVGCWFARRQDKRALADLSQQIKYRDEGDAYKTAKSKEEEVRARDYVMIKAIPKHRMATRYKSWRVQTLQLLKTEHVFGGIIWRPVFSSFTRPRRITCLFVIFIGNLTLNILFLGRGGFDLTARIAAGIVSAIVIFPIGVIFIALFKAIDSDTTWKMHRRRRVRRVQESVAVRGAMDILGKKAPQPDSKARGETFVPHPPMQRFLSKGAASGPPAPSGARPEFVRRASPKDMDKKGFLADVPPPPPAGIPGAKSLRRRLAEKGGSESEESSRATSAASFAVPPPPKALMGTETFVRRNEALRGDAPRRKGLPDTTASFKVPPPPVGKSNRPQQPPPPPIVALDGQGGFVRRTSVRNVSEEKAVKEDVDYKPQAAPPPPPPPRDAPAPPGGVNPRPAVPNVNSSFPRQSRAGGDERNQNMRRGGVAAPPVTISSRPAVPQGLSFKPVNMASAMQSGQGVGILRGVPQSLQPSYQSLNPPPPPGQSMYPSARRTSQAPPPPPPAR